ncbi:hypothetical protein GGR58DRAFT_484276 [Xylaria digitata]|nr:hypothetical protein GGR58DRAFT_484276 [Xylaria digitata]
MRERPNPAHNSMGDWENPIHKLPNSLCCATALESSYPDWSFSIPTDRLWRRGRDRTDLCARPARGFSPITLILRLAPIPCREHILKQVCAHHLTNALVLGAIVATVDLPNVAVGDCGVRSTQQ